MRQMGIKLAGMILNVFGYGYILLLFLSIFPAMLGYQNYIVLSGSMEPELPVGSCVYVKKAGMHEISAGDIITYCLANSDTVVTHRVTGCDHWKKTFRTKGDANELEDGTEVDYSEVLGTVRFCIPFLGYFLAVQSLPGMKFLGIVLILTVALWQMYRDESLEISSERKRRYQEI